MLRNLRLSHVSSQGYVNLRCSWTLGCPAEVLPLRGVANAKDRNGTQKVDDRTEVEFAYAEAFPVLFPGAPVPEKVGIGCGAQFAVSKERILQRSQESYQAYRQWLLDTPLEDSASGRVLEYSWHGRSCPQNFEINS